MSHCGCCAGSRGWRQRVDRRRGVAALTVAREGGNERPLSLSASHFCPFAPPLRRPLRGRAGRPHDDCGEQFRGTGNPEISLIRGSFKTSVLLPSARCPESSCVCRHILLALCLLAPAVSAQAPAPQSWDAQFRAIPDAAKIGEYMQAHVRAAAPSRVAVRQGQRRVDRRPAEAVGMAGRDRRVPRPDADAENASARDDGAHPVRRLAGRTGHRRRPDLEPAGRTAPVLQRVFGRRRRHRAPGLRQLRPPAGLRGARPDGRLGERRRS